MRFRKTNTAERGTYKYIPLGGNGQPIELRAGVDGITELDIKTLHSLDDAEVYNNIKNSRPKMSDEQKAEIKRWEEEHPGEKAPKNWNVSIDSFNAGDNASQDKSRILEEIHYVTNEEVPADVERLREVVATLTQDQQELYQMVIIEGYSLTDIARLSRKSVASVHKRMERIKKQIEKKF